MKKLIVLFMSAMMIFALSACGGGSSSNGGSAGGKVEENSDANPTEINIVATNWKFDQETYTVAKGEPVKFSLTNEQGYHGLEIKGLGIKLNQGDQKQVVINEAGEYKIVCNISCGTGHANMISTLVVE